MDTYCASLLTIWHFWQAAATFFRNWSSGYKTTEGKNMNKDEQKSRAHITCAALCTSNRNTKFRDHFKSYHRLFLNSAEVLRSPEDKWEVSRSKRTDYISLFQPRSYLFVSAVKIGMWPQGVEEDWSSPTSLAEHVTAILQKEWLNILNSHVIITVHIQTSANVTL